MSIFFDVKPRLKSQQRGDVLLEALFGALITALISIPFVHVQNKILKSQYQTKIERLIVSQLSDQLERSGIDLCKDSSAVATQLQLSKTTFVDRKVACNGAIKVPIEAIGSKESLARVITLPPRVSLSVAGASIDVGSANPGPDLSMSTQQ